MRGFSSLYVLALHSVVCSDSSCHCQSVVARVARDALSKIVGHVHLSIRGPRWVTYNNTCIGYTSRWHNTNSTVGIGNDQRGLVIVADKLKLNRSSVGLAMGDCHTKECVLFGLLPCCVCMVLRVRRQTEHQVSWFALVCQQLHCLAGELFGWGEMVGALLPHAWILSPAWMRVLGFD